MIPREQADELLDALLREDAIVRICRRCVELYDREERSTIMGGDE